MPNITFIGAGSLVFTRNLCSDILLAPALTDSTITLMDIDPVRLEQARSIVQAIADRRKLKAQVVATTDRHEAVNGADYVITTFQQGGLDAYKLDIEIPQKYGVEQCVGDTLGPGGVFRALRTIPVLLDLCADMDDLAPDALLLNYVNPMAANCWAVADGTGRPHVGLCHSVQGTSEMLARWIGVPYEEVNFVCAGINHQAFFLQFNRGKEDVYPQLWEAIEDPESSPRTSAHGADALLWLLRHRVQRPRQRIRALLPQVGPDGERGTGAPLHDDPNFWFDYGRTGGYLRHCLHRLEQFQNDYDEIVAGEFPTQRSHEYGSAIIEAMETNKPAKIAGNVPNYGLIDNLPAGCCVRCPAWWTPAASSRRPWGACPRNWPRSTAPTSTSRASSLRPPSPATPTRSTMRS